MPQFDPSSFASQLFWLVITFTALFFVVWRLAIPRIGDVMDQRQKLVDDDLERAAQFKAEAEEAIAAYEKALADARGKAQEQIKQAQDELTKANEAKNREVSARLAEEIKAGEGRITAARDAALSELKTIAVETAQATASRVAGLEISTDDAAKAVDAAMSTPKSH